MTQSQPTRRAFLKTAAVAAAGCAAPAVWAGPRSGGPSPNDGFGVLAIGVRGRGGTIGRSAGRFGRVVACCDVDSASSDLFIARLAKQQQQKPEVYKDYRKALERKDVDIVTIGTPDHWHTAILVAAMRAGKDVYCEKPLTLTIDEGKLICRVAKETGRVVQVGTQQRSEYRQMFLKAVAIARSGRLGQPLVATCSIGAAPKDGPFPTSEPPSTLDWDFWLGQAPKVPYCRQRCHGTFRWWLEYSGGKITDWGAHHIDIAQWAIGAEDTGPIQVEGEGEFPQGREATLAMLTGQAPPTSLPNGYNTATQFKITLTYANGNRIVVQHGPGNGILLEGPKGRIFVNRGKLTGKPVEEIAASQQDSQWLDEQVVQLYGGREPTSHMQNFIDCVKERRRPVAHVWVHHRSVSSCHLCNIAMLLGRPLRWDPEHERFPDDDQANQLLSRRQRAPYTLEA